MPTIHTLGHPSRRTEFSYTGNVKEGVTLHFKDSKPTISADFFQAILNCFRGTNIPGGFCMTDPTGGGLGFWVEFYSQEKNTCTLSPRHDSFIAAYSGK